MRLEYPPSLDYGFKPPPKDTPSTMAIVPWYNSKTGETYIASNGGYTPPSSDWVRGNMDRDGKVTPRNQPGTPPPSVAPPVEVVAPPYVPYTPPNGRTLPPYAPYMPQPIYPPNTPPYYSYPPDTLPPPETVPPYIPPGYATRPPVANPRDSRGGGGRSPEEQQRVNNYFDRMTPEQKQAHAESLRTGVNFVTALMPGAWIPKAVDYAKNLYAGQQYKDVMAKEAAKNEADRVKSESNNLMSMIKDTNQTTPYSAPQGDPAQQARARAQTQVNADMTRMSANDQAKQDARVAAFDASRESTRGGGGGGMGGSNSNPGDPGRGGGGAHLAHGGIAALPLYKSKTGRSPKKPK